MATEVKQRLDAIDMIGRSITLKIMKRDPSAPLEPPKVRIPVDYEKLQFIVAYSSWDMVYVTYLANSRH